MSQVAKIDPTQHLPADPMVAMIERVVMDPNASLDKLERMLAMKERLDAANARKAFDLAISEAKAEIPPILKNRTVDFTSAKGRTHYQHEDMAEIARTVDPILSRYGLSYRFRTTQESGRVAVTCVMSHRDGHAEETTLAAGADESGNKNHIQAIGSAITYLQRYTLKTALGLSASTDDDGKAAGGPATISADQFRQLRDLMAEAGIGDADITRLYGVQHVEELPATNFQPAMTLIRQRMAKAKANG